MSPNEFMQSSVLITGLGSLILGAVAFMILLKLLPERIKSMNTGEYKELIKEAEKQKKSILQTRRQKAEENMVILKEDLEEEIEAQKLSIQELDKTLDEQDEFIAGENKRLDKVKNDSKKKRKRIKGLYTEVKENKASIQESQDKIVEQLKVISKVDSEKEKDSIILNIVDSRHLECKKVLNSLTEELSSTAKRRAQRMVQRATARYSPNFAWPKSVNTVEVHDPALMEILASDNCQLIKDLQELSEGVEIKPLLQEGEIRGPQIVRLGGGYGIYKEAARLSLDAALKGSKNDWSGIRATYEANKKILEAEGRRLGKRAVNLLQLNNVHPEIQKLIGALYWRTSFRQNQWHHTVEVAELAGMLAEEIGIDPEAAKRVGMLHDIGKAIDYRIEGSHAIISGDYADRYGESKLICDTVMSHHADLVVESPLAYVLIAADTLSGARPGARVNLEEGYQIRLGAIAEAIKFFNGVSNFAIMNGGREVHVQVDCKKVKENQIADLAKSIAEKIEETVEFPGQIKVLVDRTFESVAIA